MPAKLSDSLFWVVVVSLALCSPLKADELRIKFQGQSNGTNGLNTCAAFTSDGKWLLTGADDAMVRLWDYATGKELRVFGGNDARIMSCAISPDKSRVAACTYNGRITVWDALSGKVLKSTEQHFEAPNKLGGLTFTSDGTRLLVGTLGLKLLETETLVVVRDYKEIERSFVSVMALSPDNKTLVTAKENTLLVYDLASAKLLKTLEGHVDYVQTVVVSRDGRYALSGSTNHDKKAKKSLLLWDLESGKELRSFNVNGYVKAAEISADLKQVAAGYSLKQTEIFDFATGKKLFTLPITTGVALDQFYVGTLSFNPSDGSLVTDKSVWDPTTGKEARKIGADIDSLTQVAISEDGGSVYSLGSRFIRWSRFTGKSLQDFELPQKNKNEFYNLNQAFAAEGKIVGAGYSSYTLWNAFEKKAIGSLNFQKNKISALAFSPDGKTLVTTSYDGLLRKWDTATLKETGRLIHENNGNIGSMAFSPDGKRIAAGGFKKYNVLASIKIWDTASGKVIFTFADFGQYIGISSLAFSSDGSKLLAGDATGDLHVFDIATHKRLFRTKVYDSKTRDMYMRRGIYSLALSSDGKIIASSAAHKIKLFDSSTGKELMTLTGHTGYVGSMAFTKDGNLLISAAEDGLIMYWNARSGELIVTAIYSRNGEWLTCTPDGYFDGTPTATNELVYLLDGTTIYPIDRFYEKYFRPDIIEARLRGLETAKLVRSDVSKGFARPPEVKILLKSETGDFLPPQTGIQAGDNIPVTKAEDWLQENGAITVRVTLKDMGGGIDGVRLFVSGKAVGEDVRGLAVKAKSEGVLSRDFVVTLSTGESLLRAIGFSRDRTESAPAHLKITYSPPALRKPAIHILTVGADVYRNSKYNLNYALADAKGFLLAFLPVTRSLFKEGKLISLLGDQVTRESIIGALKEIKAAAAPADVFVFYYAGHGIALPDGKTNDFYFVLPAVTNMMDPEKLSQGAVSSTELRNLAAEISASKQILFVDACNSGAFAEGFAVRGAAEDLALAQLARSSGSSVLTATTNQQFASEITSIGHGIFTYAIIQGISGKAFKGDGRLTANSLRSWIDDYVPVLSKQYRGSEQFPTTFMFGQDFPLGVK